MRRSFSLFLVLCIGPGLFFYDLDLSVIDLVWKISHGFLYTAERLASFGYDISTTCFCSHPIDSLQHLFFYCPLTVSILSWVQSLMFLASPLCPALLLRHALFGISSYELSVVPKVFVTYLMFLSFIFGWLAMIFVFGVSVLRLWMLWSVLRLVFGFIFLCFFVASVLLVVVVSVFAKGVPVVWCFCSE